MKKFLVVWTVVLIAVVGCASPAAPSTPEPTGERTPEANPEDVINAANVAWNAGAIEVLKALFAEDAVACFPDWGDECTTGAEEIAAWIEELVASHFVIEPQSVEVDGDTVTVVAEVWADPTRELGIAPLLTTDAYIVENGQITRQTSTLTEESAARLMEAMAAAERMAVVNAANEAWNAGDVEALKALFAEDAVACFPDWGDECTSGAEEIGEWIEELVASNFAIEPQSVDVEGDTVTVVAQVWADPTRELGIAPLVTQDVYIVEGGQIASQTSTLTEESAAKLMEAMAAVASQPSAVVMAYVEAINAGDLDAAMALCHEGLYADLMPTLLPGFANLSGGKKEDVGAWMEEAVALNAQIETEILSEEGDEVTARSRISSDYLQELGAAPLVVNEVFKVQEGQMRSWSRTITVNSVSKLQEGLVQLGIPATITPEPGEVVVSTISDIVGVWTGAIPGGFEGPVEFESNGNYHMEGDTGSFWFNGPFLWVKTEKEHYAGDPRHSCKKGLIGSYVVFVTRSGDRSVGLRYIPIFDPCILRYGFFEGEIHTPR
ncbi:MAG: nuclear transport factor 2 family protein [Anaerolineae bacterium]|jgi:ketosteroid isomerase-like protein